MQRDCIHNEVRESITDAVERLIERYGYKKMTVEDIAREAGVGKGTVYLYFDSKEEAAFSWFDRGHSQLLEKLRVIADSKGSPADRLRNMLLERVMFRFDHSQRFVQSLDELFQAVRPGLLSRRHCNLEHEADIFRRVIEDGHTDGSMACDDPYAAAHALLLATNSLLPYSLSTSQLGRRDEIKMKVNWITQIVLNGLLSRD